MHRRAPSTITNNTVFFEKENIIQEMIDTEHNYVKSLRAIIDDYQKPLEKSKCISERHLKAIFNNISIIYNINSTILKSLDEFHEEFLTNAGYYKGGKSIGKIFLKFGPYFKVYTDYCNNYESVAKLLRTLKADVPEFADELERLERSHKENGGLALSHYLINPVQRLPRYSMLLKELLKHSTREVDDYENLENALAGMQSTTTHINDRLKDFDNKNALLKIQKRLDRATIVPETDVDPEPNQENMESFRSSSKKKSLLTRRMTDYVPKGTGYSIIAPHRAFVAQGTLYVFDDGELEMEPTEQEKQKHSKLIFLFSDMILICVEGPYPDSLTFYKEARFDFTESVSFIRPITEETFQVITEQTTLTFMAESKERAKYWQGLIRDTLKKILDCGVKNDTSSTRAHATYTPSLIYFFKKTTPDDSDERYNRPSEIISTPLPMEKKVERKKSIPRLPAETPVTPPEVKVGKPMTDLEIKRRQQNEELMNILKIDSFKKSPPTDDSHDSLQIESLENLKDNTITPAKEKDPSILKEVPVIYEEVDIGRDSQEVKREGTDQTALTHPKQSGISVLTASLKKSFTKQKESDDTAPEEEEDIPSLDQKNPFPKKETCCLVM